MSASVVAAVDSRSQPATERGIAEADYFKRTFISLERAVSEFEVEEEELIRSAAELNGVYHGTALYLSHSKLALRFQAVAAPPEFSREKSAGEIELRLVEFSARPLASHLEKSGPTPAVGTSDTKSRGASAAEAQVPVPVPAEAPRNSVERPTTITARPTPIVRPNAAPINSGYTQRTRNELTLNDFSEALEMPAQQLIPHWRECVGEGTVRLSTKSSKFGQFMHRLLAQFPQTLPTIIAHFYLDRQDFPEQHQLELCIREFVPKLAISTSADPILDTFRNRVRERIGIPPAITLQLRFAATELKLQMVKQSGRDPRSDQLQRELLLERALLGELVQSFSIKPLRCR